VLSRTNQSACPHCRSAPAQEKQFPQDLVPYDLLEMYKLLDRTQKALLATLKLYAMDGEVPTYGEVVVFANMVEQKVQGTANLDPDEMITRSNAQKARETASRKLNWGAEDLPDRQKDMVVDHLLFVRPSRS
jgi:hypothetical protein